jgi:hypothetical protein
MTMLSRMLVALPLFAAALLVSAAPASVVMEEFMVPAVDPGISLYVRNKHPAEMKSVAGEKIVLFVHGATFPAESTGGAFRRSISWRGRGVRR